MSDTWFSICKMKDKDYKTVSLDARFSHAKDEPSARLKGSSTSPFGPFVICDDCDLDRGWLSEGTVCFWKILSSIKERSVHTTRDSFRLPFKWANKYSRVCGLAEPELNPRQDSHYSSEGGEWIWDRQSHVLKFLRPHEAGWSSISPKKGAYK